MSKRLTHVYQTRLAPNIYGLNDVLLDLLRNFLLKSEQPETEANLVTHLRRSVMLQDVNQTDDEISPPCDTECSWPTP